jgi:hypothetical protein
MMPTQPLRTEVYARFAEENKVLLLFSFETSPHLCGRARDRSGGRPLFLEEYHEHTGVV